MEQHEPDRFSKQNSREHRIQRLVSLVKEKGAVTVKDLSHLLDVTKMTIYRDVETLHDQGAVNLLNGVVFHTAHAFGEQTGQLANINYDLPTEIHRNAEQKVKIAKKAIELIRKGETIFIDSGSTMEYFSREIPENKDLVVCCHAFYVLVNAQMKKGCDPVFSGGYFHRDTLIFESEESVQLFQKMRVNKAFFSAGGVDHRLGVTISNPFSVNIKTTMLTSSQEKILLADSSKFGTLKSVYFTELSHFDTVITDSGIPEEYRRIIDGLGIRLIIAP